MKKSEIQLITTTKSITFLFQGLNVSQRENPVVFKKAEEKVGKGAPSTHN